MEFKKISTAQRDALSGSDFAGPNRTFPIADQDDVESAAHLIGKASNPDEVRRRIIEIAKRKGLRLPEAWEKDEEKSVRVLGSAVKSDDEGHVSGYLVLFSTADDPDTQGDFFTKNTDFGLDFDNAPRTPILFDHAQDKVIGRKNIGTGTLKMDDKGVWIEGQLNMRNRYAKWVLDLAKQGKLGWSSGTAAHLVEREREGKSFAIKSWPLGLDASLTCTPAEPRTFAYAKGVDDEALKQLHSDSMDAVHEALRKSDVAGYVCDTDEDHVYVEGFHGGYTALPYESQDDGSVKLGRSFPVRKTTHYEPLDYKGASRGVFMNDQRKSVLGAVESLVDRESEIFGIRQIEGKSVSDSAILSAKSLLERLQKLTSLWSTEEPGRMSDDDLRLRAKAKRKHYV